MPRREKFTKGWVVVGRNDGDERISKLSRRYHSLDAANSFADLARRQGAGLSGAPSAFRGVGAVGDILPSPAVSSVPSMSFGGSRRTGGVSQNVKSHTFPSSGGLIQ